MRVSIHAKVKLAPPPVRPDTVLLIEPFAFAINLQTGAVEPEMQRLSTVDVLRRYRQATAPSAKRPMIRYGNGDAEHVGDRMKHPFSLSERLAEHQAGGTGFNRPARPVTVTMPSGVI